MSMASQIPFETTSFVRDKCLCLHTQRTARVLARYFDEALRRVELTNGQFSLLMSLNRAEMPTIGSVASLLATDRTTLTAALKPLERRGLIKVVGQKDDRRRRLLKLTPAGHKLLARAVPLWRDAHVKAEAVLGNSKADVLRGHLEAFAVLRDDPLGEIRPD
jgi:DNA-binding MarR family transcriptional regulator